MKKINIATAFFLIVGHVNLLAAETTCRIGGIELKKEILRYEDEKVPFSEKYLAFKIGNNKLDVLRLALGSYTIESTCAEILSQNNSIFAAVISSYGIAISENQKWYHEETHCFFIDSKTGLILAKKDQIVCLGSWQNPKEWIADNGELIKF